MHGNGASLSAKRCQAKPEGLAGEVSCASVRALALAAAIHELVTTGPLVVKCCCEMKSLTAASKLGLNLVAENQQRLRIWHLLKGVEVGEITESEWSVQNEPLLRRQKRDAVKGGQNITSFL